MPLERQEKAKIIRELEDKIVAQKGMLFFDHSFLKAFELSALREELKKDGNFLKIVKKTLFEIALKKKLPKLLPKIEKIEGPLSVIFVLEDEIIAIKTLCHLLKEKQESKIYGGFLWQEFRSPEFVLELAKLPSRQELLLKLMATLQSPLRNFLNVLHYNFSQFLFLLSQISKKGQHLNN